MPAPLPSTCVPFLSPAETLAQYQKRTGLSNFGSMWIRVPAGIAVKRGQPDGSGSFGDTYLVNAPVELLTHDLNTVSVEEAARSAAPGPQQAYGKVLIGGSPASKSKQGIYGVKSWLSMPIGKVAEHAAILDSERRGQAPIIEVNTPTTTILACRVTGGSGYVLRKARLTPRAGLGVAGVGAPKLAKRLLSPAATSTAVWHGFKNDGETIWQFANRVAPGPGGMKTTQRLYEVGDWHVLLEGRIDTGITLRDAAFAGGAPGSAAPGPLSPGQANKAYVPAWAFATVAMVKNGVRDLLSTQQPEVAAYAEQRLEPGDQIAAGPDLSEWSSPAGTSPPVTPGSPAKSLMRAMTKTKKPSFVGDPRSLPAHLRDPNYRPLKPMAITPAAAMKHNIAKNFDGLGNVRPPATLSCQEGFALYQGKCIPKARVPGGSLAGPAPAGTTRELIDRIAAQVASQAAAKPAIYVVARNEGTSTVAQKLRVSIAALLAANPTKPTITLGSGQRVFAQLTVGEKLNVPTRGSTVTTVTGGGMLAAGPGEPCDSFDWCPSGYSCVDGICQADFVPAQAGMSNEGSYCDAGGGPQSGYINGGVCVPLGSSSSGDGGSTSQSVTGDILCPGPNMQISLLKMACICEDGFVPDPNGPGCVPEGSAGTYAQASLLCTMTGGTGTNDACSCPSGFTWDWNNGCVDSKGKPGGLVAQTAQGGTGGTAGGKPGGGAKPGSGEPPVDAKGSLMGSLPSTPWLVGGALAIAAVVGGGAYAVTRSKKKAGKGKDKKADKAAKKAAKAAKKGSKLP